VESATPNRSDLIRRGQWLEYFTIGYNIVEGLISIVAGLLAGFGGDAAVG